MHAAVVTTHVSDVEAVETLREREHVSRLEPAGERCSLTVTSTEVGPLSLGRARFEMVADLRGCSWGVVGVGRARAGRLGYTYGTEEVRWRRGDLFLAVEPASDYVVHVDDADVDHTTIDLEVFAEVVELAEGRRLRFDDRAPVSARAATTWVRTWDLACASLGEADSVSDLVVGQLSRMLAALTLSTFPNDLVTEPTWLDRRDARPPAVRRALSLMESSPDLDLTLVDLARAACVSPRALQLAFRRHLDTTPTAHLRRVRLDRARADLLAAVPGDGTTVTEVAARWGWARPARFAASYRRAYGRHPHEDLARTGSLPGR